MKKIFIILSAVVTMLFCVVPVVAHADLEDVEQTISDKIEGSELDTKYGSYDEFRSGYHVSSENYEFLCKYHIFRTATNEEFYFTAGLSIPQNQLSEYVDSAVMDGSVFDIHFKIPVSFYVGYKDYSSLQCNNSWYFSISRLTFDTASNVLNLYNVSGSLITQDFFTGEQFSPIVIDDYTTNFEEFHSANSIYASIFPELKENFDYTAEFEGDNLPLNILQVDIHNDTNKPYQYAILIQPEGAFLEYEEHSNSRNLSVFWGNSDVTYALIKDEWFYTPVSYLNGVELINAPCAWHFVGAGEMKREHLYYEQMQLKQGVNYVFKVLAFDLTKDTLQVPIDNVHSTASPYIEVIYSKNFSVAADTVFNPTSISNGCYSYDPTIPLDAQFDKVKGIYDKSSGQVKITEGGNFSDIYKKNSSSSSGYSSGSLSSNSSFNDLLLYSSSYLSLCKSVLSYFPPWVLILIMAGLVGIIVIALWKKL